MEKEYFVKVDVNEELPTSDGFYFVVEGKDRFVKSLGLYDSRRKKFMLNVHSWLKPLPSMPEQEWVSVKNDSPKKSGWYLCYFPKQNFIDTLYFRKADDLSGWDEQENREISHWQPLPQPPTK